MTNAIVVSRNKEWMTAWVGNELMMMCGDSETYLSLSYTGGRIWEMLERSETVEQLSRRLASEYEVNSADARLQLIPFLEQMAEDNTIRLSEESHG